MSEYYDYDKLIESLQDSERVTQKEAEQLAQKFFIATHYCNKEIRRCKSNLILTEEAKNLSFKKAIETCEGKNITEKKISAEADKYYRQAVKFDSESLNEYEYYKRMFKVLENGYTLFKLLSREG